MKKLIWLSLGLLLTLSVGGQSFVTVPEDKAVVYFVRTVKGGLGMLANTFVFDTREPIGMLTYQNFIRFECEPGAHKFWIIRSGISEITFTFYKQFVDADLLPGKIYLIEVRMQMEGIAMEPVDPLNNEKALYRVKKVLNKKASIKANKILVKRKYGVNKIHKSWAEKGMNKYEDFKDKGKVEYLDPKWFLEPEDLVLDEDDKRRNADF